MSDSTKFCRYCGASIPVDSEFCEKCGRVLTPEKEIVKVSQPAVIRERQSTLRRGKLLLAIIVIALALTTVFVLSFAPNPLVKNRPWVSVEGISFTYETDPETGATIMDSLLIITIHNPTHSTPIVKLHADLDAYLSYQLSYKVENLSQTFHYTHATTNFQIFGGNWAPVVTSGELPACSPSLVGLYFSSYENGFPNSFNNGTFHLNLVVSFNGVPTTFTDDWTANFVSIPLQTTATTTTTTGVYTPPNECLFPWV